METKKRKMAIATIVLIVTLSLLTVAYAVTSGLLAEFEVTTKVKTKATLSYDNQLAFGDVEVPSNTTIIKELTNIGETDTKNITYSIYPLEGLTGISVEWDYDGAPIPASQIISIGFTLVVTEEAQSGMYSFFLQITEIPE